MDSIVLQIAFGHCEVAAALQLLVVFMLNVANQQLFAAAWVGQATFVPCLYQTANLGTSLDMVLRSRHRYKATADADRPIQLGGQLLQLAVEARTESLP